MGKIRDITVCCALVVILGLLTGCGNRQEGFQTGLRYGTGRTENEEVKSPTEETVKLYIVAGNDTAEGQMTFYNLSSGAKEQYAYTEGTFFRNRYGANTSVASFTPGTVVKLERRELTTVLSQVQMAREAWIYEDVDNLSVDEERQLIAIGGDKYAYDEKLQVYSGEETISLQRVSSDDIFRVQGVDRKIVSLSVETGHGMVQLINTQVFQGGWLSLDHRQYYQVTGDMQLELLEGVYELTVANDGYGGTTEITVSRNGVLTVDLDTLKGEGPKYCELSFDVGDLEATLYIDGKEVSCEETQQIKYGIHRITIEAPGYDTWTKRLYVNSPEATIEVALEEETGQTSEENTVEEETPEPEEEKEEPQNTAVEESLQEIIDTLKDSQTRSELTDSYWSTVSDIVDTLTGN
ncbi:MAG: PEGA domain-containing protein [Lachnospiraceae bacterium]|nr:PEGA domain-containing protein [Lachnospiraceae bacterium]